MLAYIDLKLVQSGSSDLRAAIDAKHVVVDDLGPVPVKADIKAGVNLKDPVKIAEDIDKRFARVLADHREAVDKLAAKRTAAASAAEQEWRDLRTKAETARIAVLSYAIDDGAVQRITVGKPIAGGGLDTGNEAGGIALLFEALSAATGDGLTTYAASEGRRTTVLVIVCHNAPTVVGMIRSRAKILQVAVPEWWPWQSPPSSTERLRDTQWLWNAGISRPGLDRLAKSLGIPGRDPALIADDGAVWDAIAKDNLFWLVQDYCDDEVLRLRCIYRRLMDDLPPLKVDLAILHDNLDSISAAELKAAGYEPPPAAEVAA
jgi:hypothetical protein